MGNQTSEIKIQLDHMHDKQYKTIKAVSASHITGTDNL